MISFLSHRYLFNDAEVKPFDPSQIASECFGGEVTVSRMGHFNEFLYHLLLLSPLKRK